METKKLVGTIEHYFDKISVAVVSLTDELKEGDTISIEGPQTNFTQQVESMQIEHDKVPVAKKGQMVGMAVKSAVKKKDLVFKV